MLASIEAMLFAAGDPVEPGKLAEVLDIDVENVIKMLATLRQCMMKTTADSD